MSPALIEALPVYGLWGLGGTIAALVLFAVLRGRIRIQAGWGGWNIARFGGIERLVHWLLALSFIVLATTGLISLYGAHILPALIGADAFATMRPWSRTLHSQAAFPFMLALALAFLLWLRHSLPHWRDAAWLAMGGGLLVRRWHPAAWKFNVGQKAFYWAVMIAGLVLSVTGFALLPPGTIPLSKTITLLNGLGLRLPSNLTMAEEMRQAWAWHAASALVLTCLVAIHIYLRTYGIQGASSAMGTGTVDINWAKQHHSLWAEREIERAEDAPLTDTPAATMAPAE